MGFAAGVILGLFCFSILPESLDKQSPVTTILLIAVGAVAALAASLLLGKANPGFKKKNFAFVLIAAITVHNLPEGIALGAGFLIDPALGLFWGLLIAVHNIPIGITIGFTQLAAGNSRCYAIGLSALSGVPIVIGSIIAAHISVQFLQFSAALLPLAGGALLSVVVFESVELFSGSGVKKAICAFVVGFVLPMLIKGFC